MIAKPVMQLIKLQKILKTLLINLTLFNLDLVLIVQRFYSVLT